MAAPRINGNLEADQILVDKNGFVRTLTLNRPKQLNALSSQMILKMLELFIAYEKDPNVRLLIVKGNGRAFCAGGDVTGVAHAVNNGHWTDGANYCWNEYILNYVIGTYTKPQVSLLNGIVMGGGAGISIHGRFRVVTEKTVFAMPETALGLFPDVGASYFLSRLPGYFGEYIGLTGKRLDGSEMLASGLATHFVPSEKLELLEQSLVRMTSPNPSAICWILDGFSQHIPLKDDSILCRLDIINKCFSGKTVEGILSALEQEATLNHDEWISSSIESIKKASPTSLKITLKAIREGRMLEIDQCLIQEYRMCCHLMRKELTNDYFEGCRAILIDRDRNPKWEPSKIDMITDLMVDQYFGVVDDTNWEDLKLPERHGLNISSMSKL